MKKLYLITGLCAALAFTALPIAVTQTGCASANRTAYQTVGVTQITVDAAMNAWGAYVASGKAGETQEAQVKLAYQQYQATAVTVIDAARAAGANANAPILNQAVAAASASLNNLINLVKSFGVKL